ncbi:MAG: ATP-binding cassette domain-containing protein [Acidimicrobiales bacterium]
MSAEPTVLEARGITVDFGGIRAVDDVTLLVRPGEVVGIIGPNGAGKTTLLNAISGLVDCEGEVFLRGQEISRMQPYRRARLGLGRTFQDARLYPTMTVRDTLAAAFHASHASGIFSEGFGLRSAAREEARVRDEAEALCEVVDLRRYLDFRISELSFGTTRAVELAWLVAQRPSVLLLDEPASGLQQSEVRVLGPLIERLRGDSAVVVIDHDVPFVSGLAHRLVALDLGAKVADGSPTEVLESTAVIRSYLGTGAYKVTT